MQLINPAVRAFKQDATDDPAAFWGRAADALPWFRKWERVLDWEPPTFRWYVGAQTNLSYNCLDFHVPHDPRQSRRQRVHFAHSGPFADALRRGRCSPIRPDVVGPAKLLRWRGPESATPGKA
jgi:hypothetical protein